MARNPDTLGNSLDGFYAAGEQIRDRCLADGTSLFTDRRIWNGALARELRQRVIEEPDVDSGLSFDQKLVRQLDGAAEDLRLLAAELRYLLLLPIFDMKGDLKRERLHALLPDGIDCPEDLAAALDVGVARFGAGHSQAPFQYSYLIRIVEALDAQGTDRRSTVLDPWRFKELVYSPEATRAMLAREALLFIAHPDTFERAFNVEHKNQIIDAFEALVDDGTTDRDRALIQIRAALTPEYGQDFDWYTEDAPRWRSTGTSTTAAGSVQDAAPAAQDQGLVDRIEDAADDLCLPVEWVSTVTSLLDDKGQVVLYGPPGTGKTFVAQRIAEALAPDDDQRVLVQFHPSTSYEDFFEGYRPAVDDRGQMVYRLVEGPLARLAARATADPGRPHVLIIDEINRANLPRVLGELLFLLEYRDRSIHTLYRAEPFQLPSNLQVIGTMNTADRSISMIDAALRRRFHFVPLFPNEPPIDDVLTAWSERHGRDPRWPALLKMVNRELIEDLGGPDLQVGPSHFMSGDSLDEADVQRVWTYSIFPYIEDQLFGQPDRIAHYRWERVQRRLAALLDETSPG